MSRNYKIEIDDFMLDDLRKLVAQADIKDGKYAERMAQPHFWIGRVTPHLEEIIKLAENSKAK